MKKLLMLGGAQSQISAIKKARDMGCYIIICDTLEEAPGKKYAHEYYNICTTDKEAVLHVAKSLQIDGIVSYAADSGVLTAAYVAEKLGLPSHPYKSVETITNKELFRKFQQAHDFHIPKAKAYSSVDQAKADFHRFTLPVMIKPVDSSGSKGISKIDSIYLLEEKAGIALRFSKTKRFIIEEYIENYGPHIGGDGFSVNGKLVFRSFSNEYFSVNCANPFVSITATWPSIMPERIQNSVHEEIQRLLGLLEMKTGAYNFDIRVDQQENVYLIEMAARNGGDWNPDLIQCVTGVDLIEYTIKAALGENCSSLMMARPQGYWASYVLHSERKGIFKEIKIAEELKNNVVTSYLTVNLGERVSPSLDGHVYLGLMVLRFSSICEMKEKTKRLHEHIQAFVEDINIRC
ncbi:ATP-grasp domain-containing protein [Lysinibacillus odysseyi]|uniref:Carbamoyl-phosphate-synthetase n=1 Tax=Lysinibacillus odysseyi 34hs-1 = NBRC 100172 TaxID=1220589 RepID=A0A0A3IP58_9BACI|nr:ATP-grasp domain-containing protein [Lysinibacillus odysseyi]KGR86511.1 carbamoyl-phosphate-synthetase [Lysinibacillus odysseyi 34hs-1 = NBRC 100172]